MRKVELTMNEQHKYEVIKSLAEQDGNKTRAAMKLGCSRATVYRLLKAYQDKGKGCFIHGNRGRKPAHTRSAEQRTKILDLYNSKYWDASYALFSELLLIHEGIDASPALVRNILMKEQILSPLAHRKTRRRLRVQLMRIAKGAGKKSERREIESKVVAICDAHARRPRCKYFGEMLQMDASLHNWFGADKATLHIAVDDASSRIVGAHFCEQETLAGYYEVFRQILVEYGIPYMFFTDRRTIFEYKTVATGKAEDDSFTQFKYACKQLGVDLKTSSVAQAKGRVERMFETLQRRLPIMFRAAGIHTMKQANAALNHYVKAHNAKFSLDHDNIPSAFEKQPSRDKINLILAVVTPRIIDAGHIVNFERKRYLPVDSAGRPVHYRKGTSGLAIKTLDQRLFFSVDEKVHALDQVPEHDADSKRIDNPPVPKPKQHHIPAPNHPWRVAAFEAFRRKQSHVTDEDVQAAV
jgi:transposase